MTEATFIGPMLTALGLEAGLLTMSMYTICLEKDGLGLLSFYTLMKISKEVQGQTLNFGYWPTKTISNIKKSLKSLIKFRMCNMRR